MADASIFQSEPKTVTYPRRHIALTHYIWYWPVRAFLRLIAGHQVRIDFTAAELDPSKHYVIAANHQSLFDSLVVINELNFAMWRQLHSFRFMGFRRLFANPVARLVLISFGAFPAGPIGRLPYGLEGAKRFLAQGNTVIIFPEGRRTKGPGTEPKAGVARLALEPETLMIPMRIEWNWTKGRSYRLRVGRPVDARGWDAEKIMAHVYSLHV